jgi:biotin carboxyl carrier protein
VRYYVRWAGRERVVEIRSAGGRVEVLVDGQAHPAEVAVVEGEGLWSLLLDGASYAYSARFEDGTAVLSFHDREVRVPIEDERTRLARLATASAARADGPSEVRSVMPGIVREVRVEPGAPVVVGQPLLILEAMKMENEIRAPAAGRVRAVQVRAGQPVEKGALLVTLDPPAAT